MGNNETPQLDLDEVVEVFWPYDGPHTPEKVRAAALAITGLVRYLNNATGPARTTLPYAASTHRLLSGLSGAVYHLPQLLDQLRTSIETQAGDPGLHDDRRDRAGSQTATELTSQLEELGRATQRLAWQLSEALELSVHLGNEDVGGTR